MQWTLCQARGRWVCFRDEELAGRGEGEGMSFALANDGSSGHVHEQW